MGALKDFDKAISLQPNNGEYYYNRGLANYYLKDLYNSCYDWQKAKELGFQDAEKALSLYCRDK